MQGCVLAWVEQACPSSPQLRRHASAGVRCVLRQSVVLLELAFTNPGCREWYGTVTHSHVGLDQALV